jgi:predicted type IV restriction endonuclease
MIEEVAKADGNEAETRRRVERIFESVMGYDALKHITREYAIHGVGDTEHCDFAVQLEGMSVPALLVELKRVNMDLAPKHLKQAASYAINIGCEWALLTNGKEWKLYHILFGKPPETKLINSWNLINDDFVVLAKKFELVDYKNIKRGGLAQIWAKSNVLTAQNILKIILSEESIRSIRNVLKRVTGVTVSPEDIVGAMRHLLNEAALTEMGKIKISLPAKKQRTRKSISKISKEEEKPVAQLEETENKATP